MNVDHNELYRVRGPWRSCWTCRCRAAYRAIENGALDVLRIGKALRVPGPALVQWLNSCGHAAAAPGRDQNEVR